MLQIRNTQIGPTQIQIRYNLKWKPINKYLHEVTIETLQNSLLESPRTTLISFYNALVVEVRVKHGQFSDWRFYSGREALAKVQEDLLEKILRYCLEQERFDQMPAITITHNTASLTVEMLNWQNTEPNEWWTAVNQHLLSVVYSPKPTKDKNKWICNIFRLVNRSGTVDRIYMHTMCAQTSEELKLEILKEITVDKNTVTWP